jgi:NitT/TauT family transport system ATP-binding protein
MTLRSGGAVRRDGANPDPDGGTVFQCHDLKVILPSQLGPRVILDHVNFEVYPCEFLSIMGRSGTGKTTLLRVLAGLLAASTGSVVTYRGAPVHGPPDAVAFVFQNYEAALLRWRTIERNVSLGLEGKLPKKEISRRVEETLTLVGLADRAHDYPWQMSGGMQQRVQLARALAVDASTLLMDEPFASLDAITKAALQDQLQRIHHQTSATVVFVTHDIDEAVYLSDRILILDGRPATVAAALHDEVPRPRHQLESRELPEFLKLRREIYGRIEGMHG